MKYTTVIALQAALILLLSCNNHRFAHNQNRKPIITTDLKDSVFPLIFEAAFQPTHTIVRQGDDTYTFYVYSPGKITVESGKLIACDPIVMHDALPFTQYFPPGQYPVELAIVSFEAYDITAFARIKFSDKPVAEWKFALQAGQQPLPLTDTEYYCFGVDAYTAIFIDSAANKVFQTDFASTWNKTFMNESFYHAYNTFIHPFGEHNVAVFESSFGDGCYSTYIGFDADSNACRLLIDFQLVGWWN